MKTSTALPTALFVILLGCASMDRNLNSSFEPYSDGFGQMMFRFRADTSDPENSTDAEAIRMKWLEEYLGSNNLCGQGYEILERTPAAVSAAAAGPAQSISYVGRCKELQCW
jgi:hypothetical protein